MSDTFGSNPFAEETSNEVPDWAQDEPVQQEAETTEAPQEAPEQEAAPADGRPRDEHGRFVKAEEPEVEGLEDQPVVDQAPEAPQETAEQAPAELTEEQVRIWAGKYKDPDQLEKGYRELRDLQRRTAERAKAEAQHRFEVEQRYQQMEDTLRKAVPVVQEAARLRQQIQQQQDPYAEPTPQPTQPQLSPDMVQRMVDEQVGQRLTQAQAQAQQQMFARQEYETAATAIQGFYERHPEVEVEGDADKDIASTIVALNEAWAPRGAGVIDIANEEVLDIAYEAAQNPTLRRILEMHPEYIDDDAGMGMARYLATQVDGNTQTAGQTGRTTPRANTPVVERGQNQSPPGTGKPADEFDEAAQEYRAYKTRGGDSIFFE